MLSVIIVNWNGLRYLPACIDAIAPQLPADAEILLVDNGSHDGSVAWAAGDPRLRLVALPENTGFAGGVNAGLAAARGDLLLLLNNDAFVEPGFVGALLAAASAQPHVSAFGAVLTFAHRPDLVASAGIRLRADGVALDLWPLLPVVQLPTEPQQILGVSGGAALVRRALFDDLGGMEITFFNYLEDVDLALRARLRGHVSIVVPAARARHIYSATGVQGSAFKQHLLGQNRIRVLVRCLPGALLPGMLPQILAYEIQTLVYALLTRQPAIVGGRLAALRQLGLLLAQRRTLQRTATANGELEQWIEPAPWPWRTLRDQHALDAVLRARTKAVPEA